MDLGLQQWWYTSYLIAYHQFQIRYFIDSRCILAKHLAYMTIDRVIDNESRDDVTCSTS